MILSAIVATSRNWVIGKNNELPWRIPEDLRRFKLITMNHPIIMGRKTFESLGRPLPKRENIVVTRQTDFSADGVTVVNSLHAAIDYCSEKLGPQEEAFIIGGEELYRQSLSKIKKLYITKIDADIEGDRFFPELDLQKDFKILSQESYEQAEPQALKMNFIEAIRI